MILASSNSLRPFEKSMSMNPLSIYSTTISIFHHVYGFLWRLCSLSSLTIYFLFNGYWLSFIFCCLLHLCIFLIRKICETPPIVSTTIRVLRYYVHEYIFGIWGYCITWAINYCLLYWYNCFIPVLCWFETFQWMYQMQQFFCPHLFYPKIPTDFRMDNMNFEAAVADGQCAICLESTSQLGNEYGHLENCDHIFCAPCLRRWRIRNWCCPLCSKKSTRWFAHPQQITDVQTNKMLFDDGQNVAYF